jgi:hypothetical protein
MQIWLRAHLFIDSFDLYETTPRDETISFWSRCQVIASERALFYVPDSALAATRMRGGQGW